MNAGHDGNVKFTAEFSVTKTSGVSDAPPIACGMRADDCTFAPVGFDAVRSNVAWPEPLVVAGKVTEPL